MAFRTGDRVHQQTYGVGEILDVSSHYVTIAFDDGAMRKFVASMVVLEPSGVPRPPKPQPASRARRKRGVAEEQQDAAPK